MAVRYLPLYVLLLASGCAGSRWARTDADYALKYATHSDDPIQMAKQSVDARFVKGRIGHYTSISGSTTPSTAGGELGALIFPTSWLETRGGLTGLAGTHSESLYGGAHLGFRVHAPSRLAPFVGAGAYAGIEPWELIEDEIDIEVHDENNVTAAVYPEFGAHFWMTPEFRVTTSASYYAGWHDDPWIFTISLARVPGPKAPSRSDFQKWMSEITGGRSEVAEEKTLPREN